MDRPMIHSSSVPRSAWSPSYPHSAPPHHQVLPRPPAALYPPHDPHNAYTAPALYPNAVSQQLSHRYSQPLPVPNMLTPGGGRPRARSSIGENNLFFETPPPLPHYPSFPSPSPVQFPQSHPLTYTPVPPSKPPALQSKLSGYPFPVAHPTQDEGPIRPAPMSARRSSSSPAINRLASSDAPPPLPPLPPNYHSNYPQHSPQHVLPVPPPLQSPIPIPSPNPPYRSDSSPHYLSPYETLPPPFAPPPPRMPTPSRIPTNSPPKLESDDKRPPVDDEEKQLAFAIALSERESQERHGSISKEEEDLAKAIEESIRHASSFGMPVPRTDAGSSRIPTTASPFSFPAPLPMSESPVSSHTPHLSASRPASKAASPLMYPVQPTIDDDGAFAQWLAEEEERAAGPSDPLPEPPSVFPSIKPDATATPAPAPSPSGRKRHDAHRPRLSMVESEPPPPLYHHVIPSAQTSAPTKTSSNSSLSIGRSSSASAIIPSSSRLSPVPGNDDKPNGGRSQSLDAVSTSSSSISTSSPLMPAKSGSLPTVDESLGSPSAESPITPSGPLALSPPTANSFIDQQLLYGVCK